MKPACVAAVLLFAMRAEAAPAWNHVELRGARQDVLCLRAAAPVKPDTVLFLPGDGGWRGAARDMAREIVASGYDVYVWDTKRYLESVTRGDRTLSTDEIPYDFEQLRRVIVPEAGSPVILVGWSQGAALSIVAAASPRGKAAFEGVIALALPEKAYLAWRRLDTFGALFGRSPREPVFDAEPYLERIQPLPVSIIQAARDHFTPRTVSRRLFSRVRRPHRLRTVPGAEHDFSPHRARLFQEIQRSLAWITSRDRASRSHPTSHPPHPSTAATDSCPAWSASVK